MILGAATLLGLASCKNSEFEGYTKSENGVEYKFYNMDEKGTKVTPGDGISIRILYSLKGKNGKADTVLFDSKMVSRDGSGIINHILPKSNYYGSLEDAITLMSKNDSASFIISADSFFLKANKLNELPPYIKPGDKLEVFVKMVDVKSKKELDENQRKQEEEIAKLRDSEQAKLSEYLAANKITTAPTASGLIFIETQKGKTKQKPTATDQVTVHYTGMLLDGTVFDSSVQRGEPITFGLNQVIPGWTEGIQLMTKGSKAKLIIPSAIAYGPSGSGPIPPYSTLVFDVELIDIKAGNQ